MQWPFFISSLILGFGWILMYGPAGFVSVRFEKLFGGVPWNLYSIPGMAVTEAVALAPIAYVFCANALRQSDASLESAAQVCGAGPLRILGQVIIPMLRPPVVYSSILVFSMSVETLSVPLLYGQPVGIDVFSTFLYRNGLQSIDPDYTVLGAASVVILAVTISLVAVQAKLLKDAARFVSVRGKATRPRKLELGWVKWVSIVVHRLLRDLRGAHPDRGPGVPVVHADLHAAAQPVRLPDDEELRDDLHASTPTSSRSTTASSSPASGRCWSAASPCWP